jgi:capsid protein
MPYNKHPEPPANKTVVRAISLRESFAPSASAAERTAAVKGSPLRGLSAFLKKLFGNGRSASATTAASVLRQIYARYDAVLMTGNRRRRLMDRGSEESEFRKYDRMYAVSLGRDMHRNQSKYVALERMIARMTAGTIKCQLNTPDADWNHAAEAFFNHTFAQDCLLTVPRTHLSELCQQLVASLIREGDALVVFDDGLAKNSGRLLVFESDQLVMMDADEFAAAYPGWYQEQGVMLDEFGCIRGYIVSSMKDAAALWDRRRPNTLSVLPRKDCLVYTTDQAVLVAARYRPGQIRGVPEMLPVSIALDDADEMVKSEMLTAKRAAKTYATVSLGEPSQNAMAESDLISAVEAQERGGNVDPATGEIVNPDLPPIPSVERPHYQSIDDNDSAIVTYLDGRDKLDIHDPQRPNLDMQEFYRARNSDAAAALGVARSHSEMSVQSSYTAFRGESLMTWSAIRDRQKQLERTLLDWLADKVIAYGLRIGAIPPAPAGWSELVSWELPEMPAIDESRAINAQVAALKAGLTTYRELLGSDWKEKLQEYGREVDEIRRLNLPLSILETVSGAPAGEPRDNPGNTTDE